MAQLLEQEKELVSQNGNHADPAALELKPAPAHKIASTETKMRPSLLKRVLRHRRLVLAITLMALIATVTAAWFYFGSYETTDDAQVDGHLHPVSARINGTIIRVNPGVENNHYVAAGTVLAEIDPADFQADRDRA
ncbi:MAG TPA: hypothetical protein VJA94_03750, partial [Candidatus Angelobacter sp.]